MQLTLRDLASRLNGTVTGDSDAVITGVAGVEIAESGDIVFAEAPRYVQAAVKSRASAVLVTPELAAGAAGSGKPLLVVAQPRVAFVHVLQLFVPAPSHEPGVHPSAQIGEGSRIGEGAHVGANVVIGRDAAIGDGAALLPGVFVGDGCVVGAGTVVHPNAVLYPGVKVGRGCILHAGCVIGADGFGYVPIGYGLMKVPHLGSVEIGDEVEVGANSCIDRAKTGVTKIGSGTKIDNLVHIAHNVTVGQACLIIAQTGVAGSVTIGNGVVLAGQAGIKDHVSIGDGARVAAQGGVIGDVAAGVTVSGYPARPHLEKMRELGALTALPDALKRLRALEKRLAAHEAAADARRGSRAAVD
jgi:UDP-3-O-[3-hydroxymyristoyl] glucosamine N-acyltransferase